MSRDRILIVDSDDSVVERLSRTLGGVGFSCATADTGAMASEKLQREAFSIVVISEKLSDANGLDCFARLRREHRSILGVVMVDRADLLSVVSAVAYGLEHVIPRPVDPNELLVVLSNLRNVVPASRQPAKLAV